MMCVQTKNIGMSDQLATMAIQRYKGEALLSENSSNAFSYRNLKRLDVQKFVDELRDAPWEAAFVFEDTDDIVDIWYKIFTDVLDSQVPVKQKRLKKRMQPKYTLDIVECLNFWSVKEPLELLRNLPSNKVIHISLQRIKDLRKDDRKAQFTISYITPENVERLCKACHSTRLLGLMDLVHKYLK
ncbi:unnamed protein product [Porites evermanni]|uniref:Uncharacterized protein n=1 Tax=Porites evermanni TaxID=104178 RepID=A0ABN8MJ16_9CNID|nr:unnamed protein product [Porites evermanni]